MAVSSRFFTVAFSHKSNQQKYWPLGQMILSRTKEFVREPAVLFWVYGFPILMTAALAIAFRNRALDQIAVDIIAGPRAMATKQALQQSAAPERFKSRIAPEQEARMRLRTGKTDVIVVPGDSNGKDDRAPVDAAGAKLHAAAKLRYEYQYDPTRPQSMLARSAVNDQLQRAAGRQNAAEV